jgi:hypothetical protein
MSRNIISVLMYHHHKYLYIIVHKLPDPIKMKCVQFEPYIILVPLISNNFFIALSHVGPDRFMRS